jgi:hypothetical protein
MTEREIRRGNDIVAPAPHEKKQPRRMGRGKSRGPDLPGPEESGGDGHFACVIIKGGEQRKSYIALEVEMDYVTAVGQPGQDSLTLKTPEFCRTLGARKYGSGVEPKNSAKAYPPALFSRTATGDLKRIQKHPTKRFHLLSFSSKVQLCLIKPMDIPRDVVTQNVDVRVQTPPNYV